MTPDVSFFLNIMSVPETSDTVICKDYTNEVLAAYADRKNHADDSGLDLVILNDIDCAPNSVTFISYHIACEMKERRAENYFSYEDDTPAMTFSEKSVPYLVVPRSSISRTPLMMANSIGVIDAGYRGSIMTAVYNTSSGWYSIKKSTRLFQIILPSLNVFSINFVSELSKTSRGSGGFGSTGE